MATAAQIANDMAAQARYWERRDKAIARACADAARMIRAYQAGDRVDGRSFSGLFKRLLDLEGRKYPWAGMPDFCRARCCLHDLRVEAGK